MTRFGVAFILVVVINVGFPRTASVDAQAAPDFAGRWTLDRGLSQFPREVGFNVAWLGQGVPAQGAQRGGESQEDAERVRQLTAEVREPSANLTIVDTPAAVTITDDSGHSRTFHPTGKAESQPLDGTSVETITTREAGRLIILYKVPPGRELRYTLSRVVSPAQLTVDVWFVERGGSDVVKRVYTPSGTNDASADATSAVPATRSASGDRLPGQPLDQRPDAAFKGLKRLGVVVEDLTSQASACGLNQGMIETAVSKQVSDAGFTVIRNTDEDTYVYLNIITTTPSPGLCVSRYDVFLYTHTTARLSYQAVPVLVQVSLWHKGGIAGGAPAAHADGVLRGAREYVDQVAMRVRDANR